MGARGPAPRDYAGEQTTAEDAFEAWADDRPGLFSEGVTRAERDALLDLFGTTPELVDEYMSLPLKEEAE